MKEKIKAERVHGMNESGRMQIYLSRFSSLMDSCIWDLKFRWLIWNVDRDTKKRFNTHCKKGYHKFQKHIHGLSDGKREIKVEFLACEVCDYKFFSTIKDKRKYLLLTSEKRKNIKKIQELLN